jgi:hypothetical protein
MHFDPWIAPSLLNLGGFSNVRIGRWHHTIKIELSQPIAKKLKKSYV